jgi:signal transduction histidine kinase/CheY-like chemotaxis protein
MELPQWQFFVRAGENIHETHGCARFWTARLPDRRAAAGCACSASIPGAQSAGPGLKANPRFTRVLPMGISLALAIVTVLALFSFWRAENQGRRAELQLVQIEAEINLSNSLEWKMVANRQVTAEDERQIYSSLESVQRTFREFDPRVRALPDIERLHDRSLKYADALTREIFLMSKGLVYEALELDEKEVDPTLEKLHAGLVASNQAQGRQAATASRFQIAGSLGIVLISFPFMLMLFRRAQRLRVSQLAAETSNRVKGEFLANMSHEIRTPINGVLGMAELLIGTELTVEQREYALLLKTSGDSLLGVINDILDFSKIESGKLSLDAVPFDLHRTLEEVLRALALKAHQKHLELILEIGRDVPEHVTGDPARLRQILVNLIGNAVKFTQQGEVLVAVQCNKRTDHELEIQFNVTDTGIGVPAEKHSMIFEAFAQADGGTTRQYGGTGLGLAISAQLAGLMGGRIWVESAIGTGSVFSFTVQFGPATLLQAVSINCRHHELLHLPVLVVDDNATNRRILVEMTHGWGMQASATESGSRALELMTKAKQDGNTFRLALIDGHMPGMDGFELAERIKLDPELSGATIMMLTSSEYQGDAARCRELGIAAYLVKPVRKSELLTAILAVLGQQPVAAPALVTRATLTNTRSSLRILVAEDNAINQVLVVRLLQKMGHIPTTVDNGRQALEALERESFDLVLMDVQMPEMDGFSATREIRNAEKQTARHMPIIALTAHAMKGDEEACLEAGMDAYLSKPVNGKRLDEALNRMFSDERQYQPAIAGPTPNNTSVTV